MTTNFDNFRALDVAELDLVSGGDKDAKGKTVPHKEKPPVDPGPDLGKGTVIIRIQF